MRTLRICIGEHFDFLVRYNIRFGFFCINIYQVLLTQFGNFSAMFFDRETPNDATSATDFVLEDGYLEYKMLSSVKLCIRLEFNERRSFIWRSNIVGENI